MNIYNIEGKDSTIFAKEDEIVEYELVNLVSADKIVDANAAGDSFAGGFISQLLTTCDFK